METYNFKEAVKQQLVDALNDGRLVGKPISEIHQEVYNTDYFVIGRWQAEQYLIQHEGVFNAIGEIQEYEESNFGEVTTDLSEAEHVCNMLAYIYGERLLGDLSTVSDNWDEDLTEELQAEILAELED
jgi:hypothetical protein